MNPYHEACERYNRARERYAKAQVRATEIVREAENEFMEAETHLRTFEESPGIPRKEYREWKDGKTS